MVPSLVDFSKWVDAAPTPEIRQLRKQAVHGVMYGASKETPWKIADTPLPAATAGDGKPLFNGAVGDGVTDNTTAIQNAIDAVGIEHPAKPQQQNWLGKPKMYEEDTSSASGFGLSAPTNPKTLAGSQKVPILSVVPPTSIIAQATAMRYGAFMAPRTDDKKGYGTYNWRDQPIEAHVYVDAAVRHLMQWWDGDDVEVIRDDEGRVIDEVSHLAFALATIGILVDAKANQTLIDDRPQHRRMAASTLLAAHKLVRYAK